MNDRWNELSLREKRDLMRVFIKSGVTELPVMKKEYNSFAEGGPENSWFLSGLREARDAKIGAVGAEPVRQMYSEGNIEEAQAIAQQLTQANLIGAALPTGLNAARVSPLVRRSMDLAGVIDSYNNIVSDNGVRKTYRLAKEGDTWGAIKSGMGDALDILGTLDSIDIARKLASPKYRSKHAFNAIAPYGYVNKKDRINSYIRNMIGDSPVDIDNPEWIEEGKFFENKMETDLGISSNISHKARFDAWRMHNNLPQKYNMYIENPDGSYRYNLELIDQLNGGKTKVWPKKSYDYLTTSGAGLTGHSTDFLGINNKMEGIYIDHIEDVWDVNPFSRSRNGTLLDFILPTKEGENVETFSNRINSILKNKVRSDANKVYTKLYHTLYDKPFGYNYLGGQKLNRLRYDFNPNFQSKALDRLGEKINTFGKNFEIGQITGGHPFLMKTDVPFVRHPSSDTGLMDLTIKK